MAWAHSRNGLGAPFLCHSGRFSVPTLLPMIDLHTHILPGIDDGASSLEETCMMLALAAEDGITDIVATPHSNFRFEFDSKRCSEELKRVGLAWPGSPQLYLGCELHLTVENVARVLAAPKKYTLNGGDCLLVELPNVLAVGGIEAGLKACHRAGLRTVIAHPERNSYLQRNLSFVKQLVKCGCYFQLTAESFLGAFGTIVEKSAARMLKQHFVHFVASDCHGIHQRKPLLRRAYTAIADEYGESTAELLFVLNPGAAVQSQPIQVTRPTRYCPTVFGLPIPLIS
jgi:protein-tyrosine phosphatase